MSRSDRLFTLMQILRTGGVHRAVDLAARTKVSVRTIYRDIDRLIASGVPIEGSRGVGYRALELTTLSPLSLAPDELEMLHLGIAIVSEVADAELQKAAQSLAEKVDASLSAQGIAAQDAWKLGRSPFADSARGFSFLSLIRAAIKAKQKLQITYNSKGDRITTRSIRPLQIENWGRVWTVTAWCETRANFRVFRLDLIQSVEAKPEMFVDEDGKRLCDYQG